MKEEEKIEISVNEEDVQNIINCYEKDIEYIKKLETNWNELKNRLLTTIKSLEEIGKDTETNEIIKGVIGFVLNQMQELEGNNE